MRNHRKYLKLFILTFALLQCLWFSKVLALEENYKIWAPQMENVSIDKSWNVKFNKPIDETSLYNNINIVQADTNKSVSMQIVYNKDTNSVTIKPLEYYNYSSKYTLTIGNNIRSQEGLNLKEGIKVDFTVTQNINNPSLLKEVFSDPGTEISNKEEYYNAIRYALSNFTSKITLKIKDYNSVDYSLEVANRVLTENPILNYGYNGVRASISRYTSTGPATMELTFSYDFTQERMEYMKKTSRDKAREIISKVIKPGMSDFEKELALHNYIVNNARYDTRLYSGNMPKESYLDYGVLVEGVGVCDSYARAMFRLLNEAGIECIYVTGDVISGGEIIPHAWNQVKIDGKYYQLDATWNDPVLNSGGNMLSFAYFNVTDTQLSKDHIWDKSNYQLSNDERFSYLSDMNFPVINGEYIYYSSDLNGDKLYSIKINGTGKRLITSDRALYIALYDGWIYYSNYSFGGYIFKVKLDGTSKTQLIKKHSINLRIQNGVLYYKEYDTGIEKILNIL